VAEPTEPLDAMAFQLIVQKLATIEQTMQALPPLLKKIVDHLEAQTRQPEVKVATYAQLYPELEDNEAAVSPWPATDAAPVLQPPPRRRFWRWFVHESPQG